MKPRILALVLLAAWLAAGEPAPATIVNNDKTLMEDAFVVQETLDGVEFMLGQSGPRSSKQRGKYLRVDYAEPQEIAFLTARSRSEKGQWAQAAEDWAKLFGHRYNWVREEAMIEASRCWQRAGRHEEAIPPLQRLEKEFPRSVRIGEAVWMRGMAEAAKGDKAAAAKTFAMLAGKGNEWGSGAAALGLRGQASLLRQEGKAAEAAVLMAGPAGKLQPEADGFAELNLELADTLIAAAKPAEAVAIYRKVALAPVGGEAQAKARLGWAKGLLAADAKALAAAFDQAAIAFLVRGGDGKTQAESAQLAKQLAEKLSKDGSLPPEDQREYRTYLSKF